MVSDQAHTLSVIQLYDDIDSRQPYIISSVMDTRLDSASAIAVEGSYAYVASRWCETCLIKIAISNRFNPNIVGDVAEAAAPMRLRGLEHVARGILPGGPYHPHAFITHEYSTAPVSAAGTVTAV